MLALMLMLCSLFAWADPASGPRRYTDAQAVAAIEAASSLDLPAATTVDGSTVAAVSVAAIEAASSLDLPAGTTLDGASISTGSGSGPTYITFIAPAISSAYAHYPLRVPVTGTVTAVYVGAMAPGGSAPSGLLLAGLENVSGGGNTIIGEDLDGLTEFTVRTATLSNTSVTEGQILTAYVATSGAAPSPGVLFTIEITPP